MDSRQVFVLDLVYLALEAAKTGQPGSIHPETRAQLINMLDDLSQELHIQSAECMALLESSLATLAIDPQPICGATYGQQGSDKIATGHPMYALAFQEKNQGSIRREGSPPSSTHVATLSPTRAADNPRLLVESNQRFANGFRNISVESNLSVQQGWAPPESLNLSSMANELEGTDFPSSASCSSSES